MLGLVTLVGVGVGAPSSSLAGQPSGVQIRQTDYRQDRVTFQTTLRRSGPAPQMGAPLNAPAGVTQIEFPSGELRLKAWVGMPEAAEAKLPVVIFLHGGFAFGLDDFKMAAPYREAGFVVVTPVLRGENGQAGAFSLFYDEVDDVLAVAKFMQTQPYVDAAHIYLAGHSVGGTMALLSGMAASDFKAVASLSGSPDQIAFTANSWNRKLPPFDKKNPREFEMRSPLSYAASLKSPTRLYYGTEEDFFRDNTQRLVSIAKAAGLPVDYREMPGNHFSAVPAEIADSIQFFRAHW